MIVTPLTVPARTNVSGSKISFAPSMPRRMYVPLLRASPKPLSVTASPTRKRVPAPSACSTFARPASPVSSLLPSVTVPVQLGSALPNVPSAGRNQILSGQMSTVSPSSANTFAVSVSVQPGTASPL